MGAYGYADDKIVGGLYGLDNQIEGGWVAKENIEFGWPAFGYVGDEKGLWNFKLDVGKIAFDANFVASNSIVITVNGVNADPVVFDTDQLTTAGLVVDAINALDGVKALLDSSDVNNRTFLIQVKGKTAVVAEAITGGASQATGTITYNTSQVFVGGVVRTQNAPGLYEQYDAVNVLVRGNFYASAATAVNANSSVYIDNSGADIGEFSNAGLEIDARYRETISAAGIVRVEVNGQKALGLAGTFANI